jgi:hypothetical protein
MPFWQKPNYGFFGQKKLIFLMVATALGGYGVASSPRPHLPTPEAH